MSTTRQKNVEIGRNVYKIYYKNLKFHSSCQFYYTLKNFLTKKLMNVSKDIFNQLN